MIGHLQQVYEKYKDKGFVLLGFNSTDSPLAAQQLLKANGVTFPNVLDNSESARKIESEEYLTAAVPQGYIIDRDGKVVVGWYGGNFPLAEKTLAELGVK